jgi:hypothetical protein
MQSMLIEFANDLVVQCRAMTDNKTQAVWLTAIPPCACSWSWMVRAADETGCATQVDFLLLI